MQVLDNATIDKAVDLKGLVDFMADSHRRGKVPSEDILMQEPVTPPSGATFLVRAAWLQGELLGLKCGPIFPSNVAKGLPAVNTSVLLFDGKIGTPVALMDGLPITNWKTAADSALGARFLSREDAKTHLMVGAGTLGFYLPRAMKAVRPGLNRFLLWNRGRDRAEALKAKLAPLGFAVEIASDLQTAVGQADIISTATFAEEPLIKGAWLKEGTHLDLVGSYMTNMQEADPEAMKRARIFVDSKEGTIGRVGELTRAIEAGAIKLEDILGDLYDLCGGKVKARLLPSDITVFKNAGGGHLDLMTAGYVAKKIGLLK